ncbi:SWF/SNF helicase family protein [Paenibacillus glycanilyticus]|uniref:helicase-related protein n=1 Tax=Paenibacillus glycanilyticus TaxID=126569 RepID=UPI00203CB474|nr:C-terminal helicase domain-containing protein [Paenibacillus glycanilyticus]MCM3628438.1 SWF/SNF helicase family protein [Paenibacillus glycanilyticus]
MNISEKQIVVSLEPEYETEYLKLLNDYFTASERNSRASSIHEKKQLMAIKEQMAIMCNQNAQKLNMLKSIIRDVSDKREKAVVISKSTIVTALLFEELSTDEDIKGVFIITTQLSIHELNALIDRFNKSPDSTVLLITDSVNAGLDVTAANHLVHYDYPARYSDILQRNKRISRQTSYHEEATIYYLLTSGKIDEFEYLECQNP